MSGKPRGLADVVAASTAISDIDGEKGQLVYRGYDIHDIAGRISFEECVHLLQRGTLPTEAELDALTAELAEDRTIGETADSLVKYVSRSGTPMEALRTLISALAVDDPDGSETSPEANRRKATRLVAQMPMLVARYEAARRGRKVPVPAADLGIAGDFLLQITGERPSERAAQIMDECLVLHADHTMNASTFTARVIAATLSDMHSAITGAMGALRGPLHGGANEAVMNTLLSIDGGADEVEASLSSYALIALGRRRRALLAAFQYLVIGTVGGTFLLIGVGLAYAVTGTLNMADLAARLPEVSGNRALTGAVVFVFVGLAIKMAVVPLHAWLPGAYGEAPSVVSVVLAAVGTKVAIYAFARFTFTVFGVELVFDSLPIGEAVLVVGSVAMLVGAAVACFQQDFKRLLAWSSIGQIGMIVTGIGLASSSGVGAAYLHLINHAIIKGALFAAAGILLLRLGSTSLDSMAGLGRQLPLTFAAVVVAGLGLIGVPPTAGFVSKWALAAALVEDGQWLVLGILLASSLLAMVYVGRIVEVGWFRAPANIDERPAKPALAATEPAVATTNPGTVRALERTPLSMAAPVALLVLASLYFGIDASWTSSLADGAASVLIGGGSR